jgi:hypothetical protein
MAGGDSNVRATVQGKEGERGPREQKKDRCGMIRKQLKRN